MKYKLYRLISYKLFFFYLLFLSEYINGKKARLIFFSNHLVNSIKIEPDKNEIFYSNPYTGIGNLIIDCEPGDKIIINMTLKNNIIKKKNAFCVYIEFYDQTKYFFNNNNVTINYKNGKKDVYLFFYIPYETYCKNNIINIYKNNVVNIDLKSNVFIKNHKIQSLERLDVNITDTFPSNLVIYKHNLTKKHIIIFPDDNNYILTPIIIKYKGLSITGGSQPLNECSIKIIYNNYNPNYNFYINQNRMLDADKNEDGYTYYKVDLFNNEKALENKETIERFFKEGINIFDINENIFNDLCIHVEEDGKDVVLDDRIELYFQNYSVCNLGCIISGMDMKKYIVTCKCSESEILANDNIGKTKEIKDDEFSKESINEELSDIFFETNLEVLHCFQRLLSFDVYLSNIGSIMTTIFMTIQSVAGIFLLRQIKDIRIYLYKDIIKHSNPPKKINSISGEENNKQCESVSSCQNMKKNYSKKDIYSNQQQTRNKRKKKNDLGELSTRKALIFNNNSKDINYKNYEKTNINNLFKSSRKNKSIQKIYPMPKNSDENNNIKVNDFPLLYSEHSSRKKLCSKRDIVNVPKDYNVPRINKNILMCLRKITHNDYFEDSESREKTLPANENEENKKKEIKNENKEINNENKEIKNEIKEIKKENKEKEKEVFEEEKEIEIKNILSSNKHVVKIYKEKKSCENKAELSVNFEEKTDREKKRKLEKIKSSDKVRKCKTRKSEQKRKKTMEGYTKKKEHKDTVEMYNKKDFDEDDLNELDFDEALIFDHRGFCELCWMEIKQRQLIVNTFFVKEKMKPFSIKLIVFIFSISCYFVVNGFLYDSKYVSKRLKRTSITVYFFIVDSFKRIVYSTLVIALINIIVGFLFRSDKSLRKAKNKYKDNRILLNGEVVKIFKNMKIINFIFTIVDFIFMILIWIYLLCFCGVYPNCQIDWIGSTGIIIGIMQMLPILISILLALLRIIGLRCGVETCFKINAWISDNT